MHIQATRVFAAFVLMAAAWDTASACTPPRISLERVGDLRKEIGRGSFQVDPGVVIAQLTFSAPDAAPTVETLFSGGDERFAQGVVAEAKRLRTPCATASEPAKSLEMHRLSVAYVGTARYREAEPRLKHDLQLTEVVRLIKDLKSQHVRFDLREMDCPFVVRFSPYRPYLPNQVEEAGYNDARRAPFLDWLRSVTLDIPRSMMVTAIGRDSFVSVPCAVLDLS